LQGQFCMYKGGFLFVTIGGIMVYRFSNEQVEPLIGSSSSFPAYFKGEILLFADGVISVSQNSSVGFLVGE